MDGGSLAHNKAGFLQALSSAALNINQRHSSQTKIRIMINYDMENATILLILQIWDLKKPEKNTWLIDK